MSEVILYNVQVTLSKWGKDLRALHRHLAHEKLLPFPFPRTLQQAYSVCYWGPACSFRRIGRSDTRFIQLKPGTPSRGENKSRGKQGKQVSARQA